MSDASLDYAGYDGDERSRWERLAWIDRRPISDFGVSEQPTSTLIIEPTPPVIYVEVRINRDGLTFKNQPSIGGDNLQDRAETPDDDGVTRASIVQGVMGIVFLLIGFFAITLIAVGWQKVLLIGLAYGIPLGLGLLYWCLRPTPRNARA